ncbi:hypothetical protein SARC_03495 [Sphaeroforma arctica JP610]|uniref:MIF4G domain-containing protein n=1 Tax=Sphaeroforma arctica JP610 TaxID=667725 RepID=A0A0L0G5R4_9EUKA|nr:hypothetical protein SARC_03495 [Sphaeroforma arctica JP610]KNC84294.1 hypothetical protein SARC_03495 [Sphaeroforma arctica JP610]|eukprot:XP_014158196.1 hypothetical protein SARC_03495 [Sphaeroforma arctica JP610]
MPDLIGYVTEPLEREFRWQQAKSKKQVNLDFRTRVIRYFAELTKFGVYKKQNALNVLQRLVADFVGFNIDLACVFLEHCGVFLYRSGESHARTAKYLEIMMRKRAAQRMDAQHVSAIENAFYICNPPPSTRKVRKDRPSVQLYIRHLLYTKLNKSTCIYVTKQIRKLPWGNPEVRNYAIKCLSKPWKCKHGSVRQLAAVVDGLDVYQEGVAMRVVDATVEHIRLGLEVNRLDWNRMRLSTIHYFGELYVYQMVSTSLLQDTLYTCLLFGHDLYSNPNAPSQSPLDPPGNYFRVRLVCALLDVVGLYLTGSNTKKKLEFFLMFFQRYSLGKQLPLPVEVDFLIQDIFDTLAPKAKLYSTWVEANEAILTLQNQLVGDALQKQREDFEKKNPTTQTHTKDSGESTNATTAATQSPAADTQVSDAHTPSVVVQKAPQDAETASISGSQLSQSTSLRSLGGSEAESDLSDNDNDNEAASELDENGEAYDDNDTYGGSEAETRGDRNGNPESDAESESELDEKKQQPSDKDECDSDSDNDSDRTTAHDSDDGGFNSVRLRKAPQPHEPDEFDLMFIDEFSKFASDQNVARRNEAKTSVLDIPIPISVKKVTLAKADQMGTLSASAADAQRNSGTNSEMTDEWPTLGGGDEDINRTQTPQQAQSQVHHEDTAIARALAPTSTVAVKAHYGAEGMVRKPSPGGSGIKFALMTKKGNKPQLKDIDVPMDSTFALNIKKKQEEELAEQRELKRFVLDYEERAEEMEAQEALQEQRAATWKAAQQAKKPPTMENRQSEREDITSKFTSIAMGPRRHPPADNSKRNR